MLVLDEIHNTPHQRQTTTQNQTTNNPSPKPITQTDDRAERKGQYRYLLSYFQNMNPSFQRDGFLFNFCLAHLPPACPVRGVCVCPCVGGGWDGAVGLAPRPSNRHKGSLHQAPLPEQVQHLGRGFPAGLAGRSLLVAPALQGRSPSRLAIARMSLAQSEA